MWISFCEILNWPAFSSIFYAQSVDGNLQSVVLHNFTLQSAVLHNFMMQSVVEKYCKNMEHALVQRICCAADIFLEKLRCFNEFVQENIGPILVLV